jgi:hypothetical protein
MRFVVVSAAGRRAISPFPNVTVWTLIPPAASSRPRTPIFTTRMDIAVSFACGRARCRSSSSSLWSETGGMPVTSRGVDALGATWPGSARRRPGRIAAAHQVGGPPVETRPDLRRPRNRRASRARSLYQQCTHWQRYAGLRSAYLEVGSQLEDTSVEIGRDGILWNSVSRVSEPP